MNRHARGDHHGKDGKDEPAKPTNPVWPDPAAPFAGGGWEERWETPVAAAPWLSRTIREYTDWYKRLDCPRCGHPMTVLVAPGAYRDLTPVNHAGEVSAPCNCEAEHAGRPTTKPRGCGYGAWIPGPSRPAAGG
jgi:hypothetical protein